MSPSKLIFRIIFCHIKFLSSLQTKTPVVQGKVKSLFHPLSAYSKWKCTVRLPQLLNTKNSRMLTFQSWRPAKNVEPVVAITGSSPRRHRHSTASRVSWSDSSNISTKSSERGISRFTVPCLQSNSSSDDDKDKGGIKNSDSEVLTGQQVTAYDPTEDSFFTQDAAFGSKENKGLGEAERPVFIPPDNNQSEGDSTEDLSPPTNCCMSGCPNCVWIEYVEKLSKTFDDPQMSRAKILEVLNALEDENIKAFIMMELRVKKLI